MILPDGSSRELLVLCGCRSKLRAHAERGEKADKKGITIIRVTPCTRCLTASFKEGKDSSLIEGKPSLGLLLGGGF